MNNQPGLLGKKLGCTQFFDENGKIHRVTAVQVGPCIVTCKRTMEKDGYSAIQLGMEEKPIRLVKKPQLGMYENEKSPLKEKGIKPLRFLKEIRVTKEFLEKFEIGQTIKLTDIFQKDTFVDITGTTKGKGFAGVVKRHGFHGANASHGTHEYFRHGGSVGQNMTPGRTFKGLRMPGHMGNCKKTIQNLKIVEIFPEENIILVEGSVPGAKNGLVIVREAVKKIRSKRPSGN